MFTLQIKYEQVDQDPEIILNLTQRHVDKLKDLSAIRAFRLNFSKTQLMLLKKAVVVPSTVRTPAKESKSDMMVNGVVEKMVELTLTPSDNEKIKKVRYIDIPKVHEFEGESIFGTIAKLAIPFIKNTLPKAL